MRCLRYEGFMVQDDFVELLESAPPRHLALCVLRGDRRPRHYCHRKHQPTGWEGQTDSPEEDIALRPRTTAA